MRTAQAAAAAKAADIERNMRWLGAFVAQKAAESEMREHIRQHRKYERHLRERKQHMVDYYDELTGAHDLSKGTLDMPMPKPVDLQSYTIHLSAEDEAAVRSNSIDFNTLRNLVLDALPVPLYLTKGDVVEYGSGHKYEIARLHGDSVVLRRLSASSAGEIGSTFVELLDKTEADVRSGKAVLL